MWHRRLSLVLLLTLLCGSALAEHRKHRFAFILPLSGALAQLGGELRDAASLAYENLPEEQRNSLTLTFEDDQFKATAALSAYQKVAQEGQVDAVLAVGSQSINPLVPLTEKAKTIFFIVTGNGDYSSRHFSARLWVNATAQAEVLFPYLRAHGVKRIALITSQHEAMVEYAQKTRQGGFKVELEQEVLPADMDFRTTIARLKKLNLDGIVAPLLPPQLAQFSKQLREAGCNIKVYSFVNAEVKSAVEAAGGAMNGLLYVAPVFESSFADLFSRKFGYQPQTIAATAYDAVRMFSKAAASGAKSPEELMTALHERSIGSDAALGSVRLNEQNEFSIPVRMKEIIDGRFQVLYQDK